MRPPAELARRIDIDASASAAATGPDDWQFEAVAEAIDLGGLAELLPVQRAWPLHGTGELSLGARWLAGELQTVEFRAEVADFELGEAGPDNLPFAELVLAGEFAPLAGDGWRLALEEIGVARGDFRWDDSARAGFELTRVDGEIDSVALSADFIRLAELAPVVSQFPQTQLAEQWRLYEPAGEIRDLNFRLGRRGDSLDYELSAAFAGLAVNRAGDMPGISGVSGRIRASEDSGNIEFASGAIGLDWPLLFAETVGVESLNGPVAWYQSRDDVRLLSGGLAIGLLGETARAGFDFRLPRDGSSPILSVRTELAAADLVAARRYLPRPLMAESVVSWLDRAVVGGRARDIEFVFEGLQQKVQRCFIGCKL
jgi:uncharacterized protein YhdP